MDCLEILQVVTVWNQVEEKKNMIVPPKKEEIANKKSAPEDQSGISIWNSNFKIDDEGGRVRY